MRLHNDFDLVHNNEYAITVAESGQMAAWCPVQPIASNQKLQYDEHQKDDIRVHAIPDELLNS